jgi:serine/threonine protein kinase, bacterial
MTQPPHTPSGVPASEADARARIGRYQIVERIAAGGMAEAFRARAHGPGGYQRDLVIKRILPHLAEDSGFVRAFVDEAKILGMLNHPNVVGVYDFGEDDGRHYLALEFLDGPSLRAIIERAIRRADLLPVGIIAYVGKEICHGLSAVHRARDVEGNLLGLIHRDVTPSNVMTTFNGGVKLLDFGVARIASSGVVTDHGQLKGKPGYFAPEQIAGCPIDARVDLFALGVMLHEMACARRLFEQEGDGLGETIYRIMEGEIPEPRAVRSDLPEALNAIILKALSREPSGRFASAAQMGVALDAVARAHSTQAEDLAQFLAHWQLARDARRDPPPTVHGP